MRIKTTKQMRLDELIKYVWENDIKNETFESYLGIELRFGENQAVIMNHPVGRDDTFTVSTEEELTEETEVKELIIVQQGRIYHPQDYKTIKSSLESFHPLDKVFAYTGEDFTLIWSKDTGIPAEGVIEAWA